MNQESPGNTNLSINLKSSLQQMWHRFSFLKVRLKDLKHLFEFTALKLKGEGTEMYTINYCCHGEEKTNTVIGLWIKYHLSASYLIG